MIGCIADFFAGGKGNGFSGDFPWLGRGGAGFLPAHPGESPARLWIAAGVRRHFPVQMSQEAAR